MTRTITLSEADKSRLIDEIQYQRRNAAARILFARTSQLETINADIAWCTRILEALDA